jgi:hypothetical protein
MEDGNFWHLGGVTRWNSQFFYTYMNFSRHHLCWFTIDLLLFWISLCLRIGVYNTLASKICVKLLKPPKNQIPTPNHFLSDLLTHSWFHSMLFALPGYQFYNIVMNRCLYLRKTYLQTRLDNLFRYDNHSKLNIEHGSGDLDDYMMGTKWIALMLIEMLIRTVFIWSPKTMRKVATMLNLDLLTISH